MKAAFIVIWVFLPLLNLSNNSNAFLSQSYLHRTEKKISWLNHHSNEDHPDGKASECKNLVFIGGGHAHLQAIKAFNGKSRPKHLNVILIDIQPFASYSGMVPGT